MKVSVVIPVYNEQRDISACLSSLLVQDYPQLEIIVVDDGSTDATLAQVRKHSVKTLSQAHLGSGVARNLGSAHAKGQILVFVDADMIFANNFVSQLIAPIISGIAKGTFSKDEYVANPDNVWVKCWQINRNLPSNKLHPANYSDSQPVFRAILKSEFDSVGGFDAVGYTDDWTLSAKLGYQAVAATGAVFYHRQADSLGEVWRQASWIGKRPYKAGVWGRLITLARTSFPVSLSIGLIKFLWYGKPAFIVFKPVYDLAIFKSVMLSFISNFNYKQS